MTRPMVDHVAQRERRLIDLITRLRVDISRFTRADHGTMFAKASWNCICCTHPDVCLDWITRRTAGEPAVPPRFCPNCELLRDFVGFPMN